MLMMENQIKRHQADIAAITEAERGMTSMLDSIQQTAQQTIVGSTHTPNVSLDVIDQTADHTSTHRHAQQRQWAELDAELG